MPLVRSVLVKKLKFRAIKFIINFVEIVKEVLKLKSETIAENKPPSTARKGFPEQESLYMSAETI